MNGHREVSGLRAGTRTFYNLEVRARGKGPNGRPVIELRAITPGVVDDYGSVWLAGTFDRRMAVRMAANPDDTPALLWSHSWADAIGHGISYKPDPGGPIIGFELDDFDAVPRAKQADAQVRSKTIRDCSVGFFNAVCRSPTSAESVMWPGAVEVIEEADLDEVSLVVRGAVPGAQVESIRARGGERFVDRRVDNVLDRRVDDALRTVRRMQARTGVIPSRLPSPPSLSDVEIDAAIDLALRRRDY